MNIENYAKKIKEDKYLTYKSICDTLLNNINCVIAKESTADLLGYSNGGYREKIVVYSLENIDKPYIKCIVLKNYDKLNIINHNGLLTTTINQAIVDMLKDKNTDSQILIETLANYYFEQNNSYNNLDIPKRLQSKFNKYAIEGMKYYES